VAAPARALTAALQRGALVIRGAGGAESLRIEQSMPPARTLRVTPADGTTLNGGVTPLDFDGVDDLTLKLGTGNHDVQLSDVILTGGIVFTGGDGDDLLWLDGCEIGGDLVVVAAGGDNHVGIVNDS